MMDKKHRYKMIDNQIHIYSDFLKKYAPTNDHHTVIANMHELEDKLNPIQEICDKYNIKIEDLPATLEEYIANDNDGYAGYSKCDSCKHTFEVKE